MILPRRLPSRGSYSPSGRSDLVSRSIELGPSGDKRTRGNMSLLEVFIPEFAMSCKISDGE